MNFQTKNIYLDHNATTPVDKRVLDAMLPYFTQHYGNAASKTHVFGWAAEQAVETAREQCATLINCEPKEIYFTSGSTEGINTCMKGVFDAYNKKGNHLVTVATEHKAVLDTCKFLETKGTNVTYLGVDKNGLINLNELENAITDKTILVCVMLANNETGVIQDLKKIAEIVHAKKSLLFSDTTQAIGKIPVDVQELGIDMLCMSAHKIYGPKGSGAMYIRKKDPRVTLTPLIHGGGHENNIRSGTLNVPGIVGLGKACELTKNELNNYQQHTQGLRDKLENELGKKIKITVNGKNAQRLPNTSNIILHGINTNDLIKKTPDMAISLGSACTSAIMQPSHVLKAMGLSEQDSYSSVRISIGKDTTKEEIDLCLNKIVGSDQ